ncbi:MAG: hypothetical protein JJT93_16370 [Gammaproteobacteria bacterium]|nr:hypothetical protein [Gammaproteobacteria bacterium]
MTKAVTASCTASAMPFPRRLTQDRQRLGRRGGRLIEHAAQTRLDHRKTPVASMFCATE